jgi:hypothetical protein
MIPGQDYTDSYSPVATDASVRTLFAISLFIMNQSRLTQRTQRLEWERKTDYVKTRRWRIPVCWDWTI